MGEVDVIVTLSSGILDVDEFRERSKFSAASPSDGAIVVVEGKDPSSGGMGDNVTSARGGSDVQDNGGSREVTSAQQAECENGGNDVDCNSVDDENVVSGASLRRKKHHRRGKSKKRKWKPYNKLTWEEKRELEDRESRRAQRVREERFAHGQPVAPYNTTQFLMDDRIVQEPDLGHSALSTHRVHRESGGTTVGDDSDEYYYSSPEDEEEFLQKEFSEVYDNIHAERLGSMTKLELIQEYMQLEERVDKLENKLKAGPPSASSSPPPPQSSSSSRRDSDAETNEKIRIFKQEIRKLAEENESLRQENEQLMKRRRKEPPPRSSSSSSSSEGTEIEKDDKS